MLRAGGGGRGLHVDGDLGGGNGDCCHTQLARWCPSLRGLRLHGSREERAELIAQRVQPTARQVDRDWDVLVTTCVSPMRAINHNL